MGTFKWHYFGKPKKRKDGARIRRAVLIESENKYQPNSFPVKMGTTSNPHQINMQADKVIERARVRLEQANQRSD